ncbi:Sac2 family protein [Rhizodiscina lignyota]|uniref:Sac2 family protein n=1 Tax=Rhizodiscina lignyota TaxID=1504668 RepID=A0A9P4IHP1_9PEZI|nr:Sac2 family protein [Rhizodiscina lignyota]
MWLDRFSQQSSPSGTPPPQGRASPAPRRQPYGPGPLPPRPSFGPRSSSLSLASTPSTTSLVGTARVPNGSALKNELYSAPPPGLDDPLSVLHNILGAPPRKPRRVSEPEGHVSKPAEVIEDIDFGGVSLEAFAGDDRNGNSPAISSRAQPVQPVEEYDKEKDKFDDLHRSILACDEVLKSVETYLTGFQADLGAVSAEIETLQSRSMALNTKLENRRVVEKLLGPSVEEFSLSPALVRKISEGPIDEGWIRALADLEKRSKVINGKSDDRDIKAVSDLKPLLKDLNDRAVERIRDYIVAQIKAIRSPSINAQIIQQQNLLRYKDLYAFMARHQPQLAEQIVQAYVNTMRWYYLSNFTRYHQALEKLKIHIIEKTEVLGSVEDASSSRGPLRSGAARPGAPPHDTFSLGRRSDMLKSPSLAALPSSVAEEDKSAHYLETPFRAFNLALLDNASFEYTFLTGFFTPTQSYHAISRTFNSIFEPTFTLGQSLTRQLVEQTNDGLGILLCVRLNQQFAFELQRRKVPAVESYINATNMLLWPRFQIVIDAHCDSLRKATASLPSRPGVASAILNSSAAPSQSTAPHPLTQRFATFVAGILTLSSETGDDEPVANSLTRLRNDFEAFLTKMSKAVAADKRKQQRFLDNNWSLIGTILEGIPGRLAGEVRDHFAGLQVEE